MIDVLCIGHAAYDLTMSVDHHPAADEKLQATSMQTCGGGPAANAAVQVARLGGTASFCGYLGNDLYGDAHVAELEAEGVDLTYLVRGSHPSSISQILAKPDGKRALVNFKGETPWLTADAVDLTGSHPRTILFDGHEPLLSEVVVDRAAYEVIPTVLDAGSLHRGTQALAMKVDYLVASEKFARQFCGTDDMKLALKQLSDQRDNIVITRGEAGLLWARDGNTGDMPAFRVHAIDSTGAGDAFHGAFALGVARGM
ncbi:MAG TPA: PfkB family carbohydrate kinase, partial [Mariprofundaceae bacterium]|nr:PfkB family carbohydrate kinase [Mariprofundaceae bacterium]